MKSLFILLILGVFLPATLLSQKDSLRLVCPLQEATVVPPPKNMIRYDPPDLCIVLTSIPDTIVKSAAQARVTNTEQDDEGKYGVVLFVKHGKTEYYLWYTGLSSLSVKKNEQLKAGQPLSSIRTGDKIELLMFDFETPVDPVRFLDCKSILVSK